MPGGFHLDKSSKRNHTQADACPPVTSAKNDRLEPGPLSSRFSPLFAETIRRLILALSLLVLVSGSTIAHGQTVSSLTLAPNTVIGGAPATGTVTLSAAAPSGGAQVNLSSSNASYVTAPAYVIVPSSSTTVTFTAGTNITASPQSATLTASYNNSSQQANVTAEPGTTGTIAVTGNAYVAAGSSANTNFGTANTLNIRKRQIITTFS
ncbi:MAG TPA: hypothetical protein VGS41_06695 [Chthonomonadales bacterium]|nr:hypothetical protein [Chthonomonadales bacterium]